MPISRKGHFYTYSKNVGADSLIQEQERMLNFRMFFHYLLCPYCGLQAQVFYSVV